MRPAYAFFLVLTLLISACHNERQGRTLPTAHVMDTTIASPHVPTDVTALIDTLNDGKLSSTDASTAMRWVDSLLAKYGPAKDSYAYYILIQQKTRNYLIQDETDSVVKYAAIGLQYFERQPYYSKWPLIDHYRLAIGNMERNHFKAALFHATKTRLEAESPAIKRFMRPVLLIRYLVDMATICLANEYFEDAGKNLDAAFALASSVTRPEDKAFLTNVYSTKATLFLEQAEPDSAYKYIRTARENLALYPDETATERLATALSGYFVQTKMTDSAIFYLEQQRAYEDANGRPQNIVVLKNLADAYMTKRNLRKAGGFMAAAKKQLAAHPERYDARDSNIFYKQLIEYNILAGVNKQTAHEDFLTYLSNTVGYINEQHMKEVSDVEGRYRLKNKEQEIALLNANAREQDLELKQKNQLIWLGFGTSILVLVVGLWAYSLQRQRRLQAEKEKLQQQIGKVQLEQRLLRTQMEPHFIFNSLAVMQSFIREREYQKSIRYITTFGKLLRQSLEHSREPLVTLKNELDALENYLQLQQMRFEGMFDYSISCPPELLDDEDLRIPPMILQPFTENAIQHGFSGINHKGMIAITVLPRGSALLIKIADNGKGISFKSEHTDPSHQSLSTRITRERLGMLSADTGVQSDLKIVSNELQGTLVELVVPIR